MSEKPDQRLVTIDAFLAVLSEGLDVNALNLQYERLKRVCGGLGRYARIEPDSPLAERPDVVAVTQAIKGAVVIGEDTDQYHPAELLEALPVLQDVADALSFTDLQLLEEACRALVAHEEEIE